MLTTLTGRHPRVTALLLGTLGVASATWTATLLASIPHVKFPGARCVPSPPSPSYSKPFPAARAPLNEKTAYEGPDFPPSLPLPLATHAVGLVAEESVHYALSAPEAHEEWIAYMPPGAGVVRLGPRDMNRAFIVAMFHELHCLRYLRDAFSLATSGKEEPAWGHVQHCLNLLRRAALCGADTTLERADAEHDVFELLGGGGRSEAGRVGAYHVCRDWDAVYDEMTRSWIKWWEYGKAHNLTGEWSQIAFRIHAVVDPIRAVLAEP